MSEEEDLDAIEEVSADEIEAIKQRRLTGGTRKSYHGKVKTFLSYLLQNEPRAITANMDLNFEEFELKMFLKFIAEKQKGEERLSFSACSVS
jgi:hypothetical protein